MFGYIKEIKNSAKEYISFVKSLDEKAESLEQLLEETKQIGIAINDYKKSVSDIKTNKGQVKAYTQFETIIIKLKSLRKLLEQSFKESIESFTQTRSSKKAKAELEDTHENVLQAIKKTIYFYKQISWHIKHFPKAKLIDVAGLVKLVDMKDIEENDYSLTPGRYVGVAPEEEDEDFDFEQTMQEIHTELGQLNDESVKLAEIIQSNFEELGI